MEIYDKKDLIKIARSIIYTYGSLEECAKECKLNISSLRNIISEEGVEDYETMKTVSILLKYPLDSIHFQNGK